MQNTNHRASDRGPATGCDFRPVRRALQATLAFVLLYALVVDPSRACGQGASRVPVRGSAGGSIQSLILQAIIEVGVDAAWPYIETYLKEALGRLEASSGPALVQQPEGRGRLDAKASTPSDATPFKLEFLEGHLVALQCECGFLCAEDGGGREVIANREKIGPREQWRMERCDDGTFSFKTKSRGKYLCALEEGENGFVADRDEANAWEKFRLEQIGDQVVLKAANGKYLTVRPR